MKFLTLTRRLHRGAALGLGVVALGWFGTVAAAGRQELHGHVPHAVAGLQALNRLDPAQEMRLAIGLPLRNQQALQSLLGQIYNPASPRYHQYLTPAQFTEQFGPTAADYEAVAQFMEAQGLQVAERHPNRMVLDVTGSVADVERALHLTLRVYRHPKENRTFYAPDTEPSLDLTVPVLQVSGLDTYTIPFPKYHRAATNTANALPRGGSGPGGNYMGFDFRNAYVPGTPLTGAGQVVGLLEFDGYYASDVSQYLAQAFLPAVPLQNVLIGGFSGTPGGGNMEVTLDIDMANAMAPGLSRIIVYEAANPSPWVDLLSRMANDNEAKQIGCSWGGGPPDPTSEQIFMQMAAQGQSFFDAVGDSDAFVGSIPFPGESTNIIQVGGTTLFTSGPLGSWVSEKVWNWGAQPSGYVGTCGGVSTTYGIPPWQQGIDMTLNGGSTTMHDMPDVALTADNIFIIADNGVAQPGTGGTSAAAPLWAAFTALVNQQAAANSLPPVGYINPAIYAIGKGLNYGSAFHDITTGDNTWTNSPNLFFATPGYDLCTGWGTPAGTNLIDLLAPPTGSAVNLLILTNFVLGGNTNGVIDFNECNDFFLVLTNAGNLGATNVSVTISSTNANVYIPQPNAAYPDILTNSAATNLTPFRISTTPSFVCGTPIWLALTIKSGSGNQSGTLKLPTGTNAVTRFDSPFFGVIIPDDSTNGVNVPLFVSGISGGIQKVTVSLYASHGFDGDLTFQLISPGTNVITLSAAHGGAGTNYGFACSPDAFRTTFDDDAPGPIASGNPPYNGSFKPDQPLGVLAGQSGTNVNGVWQLRVVDNANPGLSGILQCWSMTIAAASCYDGGGQCPGVDLAIGMTDNPDPAVLGSNLVYTVSVTNNGPGVARAAVVTQTIPGTLQFVSAVASKGSASFGQGVVTATLGNLDVGEVATVTVTVTTLFAGTTFSTATVASSDPELNPFNNTATVSTTIVPATADLAVGLSATPNATIVGGSVVYSVSVTNNGPAAASGVVVTNVFPSKVLINLGAVNSPPGTSILNLGNNTLVFIVGALGRNSSSTATVPVTATDFGTLVATAQASGLQPDPLLANNFVTLPINVGPAADLSIGMKSIPNPVVVGSNLTFVVTVTNNGPNVATNVVVSQSLPGGAPVFSVSASQGTIVTNAGNLTCTLGTVLVNGTASVTVVVTTTRQGTLTSSASVTAAQTDPNTGNNAASASSQVSLPFLNIVPFGATVVSPPVGYVVPGTNVVQFRIQNLGNVPNTNLVARLLTNSTLLNPIPAQQSYGILFPSNITSRTFTFTAAGTNGSTVTATLQLTDAGGYSTNAVFTFVLPNTLSFSNTDLITIPDLGPATNYPSVINISDVTATIGKVTATLNGLSHSFLADVNVLLVHPSGASTILMSHVAPFTSADNLFLTFDDAAAAALPQDVVPVSDGTYRPTAYGSVSFPDPAPSGGYSTVLSNFAGLGPNGAWKLYVLDDSDGNNGQILGGWTLTLTTVTPVNKLADLGLSATPSPDPVPVGNNLTYTFTISNAGPGSASGVLFSNYLPATAVLLSATSAHGNILTNGSYVLDSLASLGAGAVETVWVTVQPTTDSLTNNPSQLTSRASVSAFETDLHSGDNQITVVSTVTPQPADVGLSLAASPATVARNNTLIYTAAVTNGGPGPALKLYVTNSLPPGLVFSNDSQGIVSQTSSNLVWSFGNLAFGASAAKSVSVMVTATSLGSLTITSAVGCAQSDPNPANNTNTLAVQVVTPAISIGFAGVGLVAENGARNGLVDPGERVTAMFSLQNTGTVSCAGLVARLLAGGGVLNPSGPQTYATLDPISQGGMAQSQSFTFTAASTKGASITATLQVTNAAGYSNSLSFPFVAANSFLVGSGITIPDSGRGSPYPSSTTLTGFSGQVTKVTVTVKGLVHSFPQDINMLLAKSPGTNVLLMSHAGGSHSLNLPTTITFDDDSTIALPLNALITSNTYQTIGYPPPINLPVVAFPSPAPVKPYGGFLGAFNGQDPNGTWAIYVYDDSAGDSGSIAGWNLNVTTANAVAQISAQAMLTAAVVTNHIVLQVAGLPGLTYQIQTTNALSTLPSANWSLRGTVTTSTAGWATFVDTNGLSATPVFYRARWVAP